ncbi:DUF6950 family protein [Azorhizobium doebereinerae]|uniref:DUF6950 family protein n=1 Tax=Azorhizobium doebereinerae TaxID=281091 RepID=UPI0003FC578A|nr:hypothetical protein [Azorhizobium doebereinerae]
MRARVENWHARLTAVIARYECLPFAWGTSDCLTFAADAVEAITGRAFDRPSYSTAAQARRVMRNMGAADAGDVIACFFDEIAPAMAHVGDLAVVVDEEGRRAGAVCLGDQAIAKSSFGLARVPRTSMLRAFAI